MRGRTLVNTYPHSITLMVHYISQCIVYRKIFKRLIIYVKIPNRFWFWVKFERTPKLGFHSLPVTIWFDLFLKIPINIAGQRYTSINRGTEDWSVLKRAEFRHWNRWKFNGNFLSASFLIKVKVLPET